MMSHTLKRLRLKKIFGTCVRKKFSQGVGVPGLPRENNAVAQYQEFFFYPPPERVLLVDALRVPPAWSARCTECTRACAVFIVPKRRAFAHSQQPMLMRWSAVGDVCVIMSPIVTHRVPVGWGDLDLQWCY